MLIIRKQGGLRNDQQNGVTLVEYTLLLSILLIIAIVGLKELGFGSNNQILNVALTLDNGGENISPEQLNSVLNSNGNGGVGLSLRNGGLGGGSESTITPGTIYALPEPGGNVSLPTY